MSSAVTTLARIRPKNERELGLVGDDCLVTNKSNTLYLMDKNDLANKKAKGQGFGFDLVLSESNTQEDVFKCVGNPLIKGVEDGFNSTVFTYGQTGTGKTYTLLGTADNPGVIPRLLGAVFAKFKNVDARCTYLEVYMEKVRDLFNPDGSSDLTVRIHPKMGVFVEGSQVRHIKNAKSAIQILKEGSDRREVHATKMNATSSRSHTIFSLNLGFQSKKGQALTSKLVLVDLAGRENEKTTLVTGTRMKELTFINQSLFHLAQGIRKLTDQKTPSGGVSGFRDSKLTLLLSDSLTGNSKTSMIATLTYSHSAYEENLATCRFAKSIKLVKTEPLQNIFKAMENNAMANELSGEIEEYQKQIAKLKSKDKKKAAEIQEKLKAAEIHRRELETRNQQMGDMMVVIRRQNKQNQDKIKKAQKKLRDKKREIEELENRGLGDYFNTSMNNLYSKAADTVSKMTSQK